MLQHLDCVVYPHISPLFFSCFNSPFNVRKLNVPNDFQRIFVFFQVICVIKEHENTSVCMHVHTCMLNILLERLNKLKLNLV